jgi:pyruvate/2-oxoglutarate dehydrogenase complex dihydrolipoamide dehydrogenase (E3) component
VPIARQRWLRTSGLSQWTPTRPAPQAQIRHCLFVKVFDMVVSRTGLRDHEALAAGFDPVTVEFEADDHKAYYQSSHRIRMRFTGDRTTGRLLGVQLFGHRHADVAKRIDIVARLLTERYFSGQVVVVPPQNQPSSFRNHSSVGGLLDALFIHRGC